MKLYLSSQNFGNHLDKLQKMVGSDNRVLFIDNAKDFVAEDERQAHVKEKQIEFTEAGFDFYELDLRNYFGSPKKLEPLIEATPFIWASGGNTFLLRRAMAYSGLDSILRNMLNRTDMVYGGSSAGSIVMTMTLHGTENGDDPYVVPKGYKEGIIWDGLGLVYPQLVPHYGSDRLGKEAKAMEDYFNHVGMKYETLKDGEVYIVDGDIEEKYS